MRVVLVVGARPNLVKASALVPALRGAGVELSLVHTGQHYAPALSSEIERELGLPAPEAHLAVGSGPHGRQTGRVMERFERHLQRGEPVDRVLVVGDVNSTLGAALAAVKLGIAVDHVEAGLRSFDRSMPEEVNRIAVDAIADGLYASEPSAVRNLRREGRPRIRLVGNVMIDTLARILPSARRRGVPARFGLRRRAYGIVTLHRPSNVDDALRLGEILSTLGSLSERLPLVFPVHPRTAARLRGAEVPASLRIGPALGYLDFIGLLAESALVITDSGGVQEETTWLGVPCLTLRTTTERPITVTLGTNVLVGEDLDRLRREAERVLAGRAKAGRRPALWDGRAARRIAADIASRPTARRSVRSAVSA